MVERRGKGESQGKKRGEVCEMIDPPGGKRGKGRPKKCLEEVIREDPRVVDLTEDMAQASRLWQDRIKVFDCRGQAP